MPAPKPAAEPYHRPADCANPASTNLDLTLTFNPNLQELYQWPSVAEAGRRALGLRYRLLTYMYYHFDRAAAAGAPVARPLWFEFPADASARSVDSQWLLGDSVLVSPVLEQARQLSQLTRPCACLTSQLCNAACSPHRKAHR